jgi:patatin-like phospholipase/acyl hydrolase
MTETQTKPFYILSLDGGGSLGVYTLGVLEKVEALVGQPLCEKFNLIYGTSTGSIIGCLLSLGHSVREISEIYFKYIPNIMSPLKSSQRSKALRQCANDVFRNSQFDDQTFQTLTGVVATHSDNPRPLIFKSSNQLFMSGQQSGQPGYGCTISDAVIASCSAAPLFDRHKITTGSMINGIESFDGGFVANNPTLFAITDAIRALNIPEQDIKVLNVGVGSYPRSYTGLKERVVSMFASSSLELFEDTLAANNNTIDTLRKIVFSNVDVVRISESTNDPEYKTNLLESNQEKLKNIRNFGKVYSYNSNNNNQKIEQLLT